MTGFDTFVAVDWSARATLSPARPSADAIWIAVRRPGAAGEAREELHYLRGRSAAETHLAALFEAELAADRRVLAAFDFPFGYPRGFARAVTGRADPLALWAWLAERMTDGADNANNRFEVARALNRATPGAGPFWGCPAAEAGADLSATRPDWAAVAFPERRAVETALPRAQPVWKLYTAGSVGSQALLGLPVLHRLRHRFAPRLAVAPFEDAAWAGIVLAEAWPSLLADEVAAAQAPDEIRDRAQVRVLARALAGLAPAALAAMLAEGDAEEGGILGAGHVATLRAALAAAAAPPAPPPLRDDCFALPPGVDWTPVDEALERLRANLHPVVAATEVALGEADGRILARDLAAGRSNPPAANTAVDGYGFAAAGIGAGPQRLPLLAGRAAAGAPFAGTVPPGHALRVLTGAALPAGVDTVVLDEDTRTGGGQVAFRGPVKPGANTRRAGEDFAAGDAVLPAGHCLRPPDLALAAAAGHGRLPVFERLRVAVISTGDELTEPGAPVAPGQIADANRPMLLALAARWGHAALDLGRVPDDRAALARAFDRAAAEAGAILTSGGASAGDEDHVSALLRETGSLRTWRIAVKPGRPLALGLWRGVPVFGLPGNPVAAFVCALVFARPALARLAGAGWADPVAVTVPAAFSKRKKAGRREYLRARLRDGRAEIFASEGSGRISGLSWAEGLVELEDGARDIAAGDPVRFLPYGGFGL
ncbi:molybdopterin-binding protein [Roseivivax sp. CAU 1761]